jgi:hypothetical protein
VAGALYGGHSGEIAEQGTTIAVGFLASKNRSSHRGNRFARL